MAMSIKMKYRVKLTYTKYKHICFDSFLKVAVYILTNERMKFSLAYICGKLTLEMYLYIWVIISGSHDAITFPLYTHFLLVKLVFRSENEKCFTVVEPLKNVYE